MPGDSPSRRDVLRLLGAGAAWALLPSACAPRSSGFFSDAERQVLAALADAILPPDHSPGGAALGAVPYIEQLLTAFDQAVPPIFAGGPYSGRTPFADAEGKASNDFPENEFSNFLPLDRVLAAGWRMELYGSDGVPGGGPNDALLGKHVGLRDTVKQGLARILGSAASPVESWLGGSQAAALESFDLTPEFRDTMISLVMEAAFAPPEYGGNPNLAGWAMVHYEGDSQPLGYSQFDEVTGSYRERADAPLSTANPGPDLDPMDADTHGLLTIVMAGLGGRVFPPP